MDYEFSHGFMVDLRNMLMMCDENDTSNIKLEFDINGNTLYADITFSVNEEKKQTNADKIPGMTDEELQQIIMCPYDTAGKSVEIMPCVREGNIQELVPPEDCKKCIMEWLQSEAEVRV